MSSRTMIARRASSVTRSAALFVVALTVALVWRPRAAVGSPAAMGGKPRVYEIAVEDEADPWSRRDGSGYANDIVRAAFQAAGMRVHLVPMPYSRCKQVVRTGAMVACFSMSADSSSRDAADFSTTPIFVFSSDFYESVAHPARIGRPGRLLRGSLVGVVRGYEYPDALFRQVADGTIRLEYSTSELINLRKLAAGRLDAAMVNRDEVRSEEYVIARAGVTGKVRRLFSSGTLPAYFGFSRRHPRAPEVRAAYERGAAAITASGEARRIKDRWVATVRASTRQPRTTR